jgi:hypothetical protein
VWHVAQPGSKICVWIIDKVGAVLAGDGAVGLLEHAPAAIETNSAPRAKPGRLAVIRFFMSVLPFIRVSIRDVSGCLLLIPALRRTPAVAA